jgi:hypothetical protein
MSDTKFKLDSEKLTRLIEEDFNEIKAKPYIESSSFFIGEFGGIRIQVSLTRDPDEFESELAEKDICIEKVSS